VLWKELDQSDGSDVLMPTAPGAGESTAGCVGFDMGRFDKDREAGGMRFISASTLEADNVSEVRRRAK